MSKQWTMIFASFVLLSALTTATVAQGRQPSRGVVVGSGCKLNEDGTSNCGKELPPIRPATPTGAAPAAYAATGTSWWSVCWKWLTGF